MHDSFKTDRSVSDSVNYLQKYLSSPDRCEREEDVTQRPFASTIHNNSNPNSSFSVNNNRSNSNSDSGLYRADAMAADDGSSRRRVTQQDGRPPLLSPRRPPPAPPRHTDSNHQHHDDTSKRRDSSRLAATSDDGRPLLSHAAVRHTVGGSDSARVPSKWGEDNDAVFSKEQHSAVNNGNSRRSATGFREWRAPLPAASLLSGSSSLLHSKGAARGSRRGVVPSIRVSPSPYRSRSASLGAHDSWQARTPLFAQVDSNHTAYNNNNTINSVINNSLGSRASSYSSLRRQGSHASRSPARVPEPTARNGNAGRGRKVRSSNSNSSSSSDEHTARPPCVPLQEPRTADPLLSALASSSSPSKSTTHAQKLERIALYLKGHYAREAQEDSKGLETLLPEDVLGLAQCFYVDAYRLVRSRRLQGGMDVGMFGTEDPPVSVIVNSNDDNNNNNTDTNNGFSNSAGHLNDEKHSPPQVVEANVPVFKKPFDSKSALASKKSANPLNVFSTEMQDRALGASPSPPYKHHDHSVMTVHEMPYPPLRSADTSLLSNNNNRNNNNNTKKTAMISYPRSLSANTTTTTNNHSSGIVKRPLKELMPLLRKGSSLLHYVSSEAAPHLLLFQVQDIVCAFKGSNVLMPHLTWGSAAGGGTEARSACNLIHLEAVHVGPGAAPALFRRSRKGGHIVNHTRQKIPDSMCAVLVFRGVTVGVGFMEESDRQVWVGALMGVVERNRSLEL